MTRQERLHDRGLWVSGAYLWPLLVAVTMALAAFKGRQFAHTQIGDDLTRVVAIVAVVTSTACVIARRSTLLRVARLAAVSLALVARGLFLLLDYPLNPAGPWSSYNGALIYAALAWATYLIHHYAEAHRALRP